MTIAIVVGQEMRRTLSEIRRAHELLPGAVTRAPLGSLSCPYSRRDALNQAGPGPGSHHAFRPVGTRAATRDDRDSYACANARPHRASPWHWCASLRTHCWNPPMSERQHARQRVLAVIVAFVLAAILAQAGW